ncbi:hypothetical protein ACPEEZ_14200 [Frigoribacterium sp. 2-23]
MSNSTLTDNRAPRLLDGHGRSWYPEQVRLPGNQEQTTLELDTLS